MPIVQDFVLDDIGTIAGLVVDDDGQPVAGVSVGVYPTSDPGVMGAHSVVETDAAGGFTLAPVRVGAYRVSVIVDDPTPNPKQDARVAVAANATATARLVIAARKSTIAGAVVDASGKPVTDAYVFAVAEEGEHPSRQPEESADRDRRHVRDRSPREGRYTVRASRSSGGEAVVAHVATGARVRLQIAATGAIVGHVRGATAAVSLVLASPMLPSPRGGTSPRPTVPTRCASCLRATTCSARHPRSASSASSSTSAPARQKTLDLVLDPGADVIGRVVDRATRQPVAQTVMFARFANGGAPIGHAETDAAGRFRIAHVPVGTLELHGMTRTVYGSVDAVATVTPTTTSLDLGDLEVFTTRESDDDKVGVLGVQFVDDSYTPDLESRALRIRWIDPEGPAAQSGLRVGDIVTSIDGIDITGVDYDRAFHLYRAPIGTHLVLGLARGVSVTIVLARP